MKRIACWIGWFALLFLWGTSANGQEKTVASANASVDDPSEIEKFKESCESLALKSLADCGELLFTGKPVHIAVGSMAPQNGFGAGLAYVGFLQPTETWRPSWNADAVASGNGSWRAGVYFKFVHTPNYKTAVHYGKPKIKANLTELPEHTVVNLVAEATSLNTVTFFGLGPDSAESGRSYFAMREVIVGSNVVKPFSSHWNVSLLGEVNGRFVAIGSSTGHSSPSIDALYTDATAPGLSTQPGFLQFGESIRLRPVFFSDLLHLNYEASYRQFIAPGDSRFSFQRFTVDLGHEFALYRTTTRFNLPRDANGPDECSIDKVRSVTGCSLNRKQQLTDCEKAQGKDSSDCPAISRDRQGSIGLRLLFSTSFTQGQNVVPFYFQPTLGGGDINGNATLASYQDYRFRAPNIMLIRENFEHSIWGPLGFTLAADEGKVALERGDLGSSPWLHTFSTGLTLRAGGFPQVYLLFAWGGSEGTHLIANMNTSLLGGSTRPSLY